MVAQPLKVAEPVLEPKHSDHPVKRIQFSAASQPPLRLQVPEQSDYSLPILSRPGGCPDTQDKWTSTNHEGRCL